ncbi:MAG: 4Fe-4S binding protein [Actinobacteria bacterium]|nr:4Fe-4S binding protein [Actinomycetota bacterium]MBU1942547.1 4Fe-4S binding protein [Actinomycetota bacterium]MBU2687208.1 4Fe-4S binding protein [Actinomycetota bacterium]
MEEDDVYEQLRRNIDTYVTGCPPAPEIDEILRLLFSEDEALLACGLAFVPRAPDEVAEKAGFPAPGAAEVLEALADRGVVMAREKDGTTRYSLLPVMPGLFEFPFMKGESNELTERLAPLWRAYMPVLGKGLGSPGMAISRIVPIQEEVESAPGVLTCEMLYDLIDRAKAVGIAHCACRESEQRCDAPREACMVFDGACDFLVEHGFARYITKDEMKRMLRELDEAGLVHQVNNSRDKLSLICNCCPCCCHLLRSLTEFDNPSVLVSSGFLPEVDPDVCVGCGTCADQRCVMGAILVVDDLATVEPARCIGCGLCVTGCPERALTLVRREGVPEPAATGRDVGLAILSEKGKLEDFIRLNSP